MSAVFILHHAPSQRGQRSSAAGHRRRRHHQGHVPPPRPRQRRDYCRRWTAGDGGFGTVEARRVVKDERWVTGGWKKKKKQARSRWGYAGNCRFEMFPAVKHFWDVDAGGAGENTCVWGRGRIVKRCLTPWDKRKRLSCCVPLKSQHSSSESFI